jgi:hypothetical protein
MGDHLSPIMEGFDNPTMDTVFGELLQVSSNSKLNSEKISFLKSILTQQRTTADSLMKSAKKIVPISQKIMNSDGAYDAAFESDITAPLPKMSGTLQGFTLVFFIISFISLAIIACILVSQLSNNTNHTITAIVIFIVLMIVSMSLIIRYG